MLEKGTSGLMSGEGKRAAASRPRTALFLDSTKRRFGGEMGKTAETHRPQALPYRQFGARTGFAVLPQVGRFSDSPSTCARLVDGRNLRNVRPHASSSVSLHIGAILSLS